MTIVHYQSRPSSRGDYTVRLIEADWQRTDGQRMSREHLLMALAEVDYVHIRAVFGEGVTEVG